MTNVTNYTKSARLVARCGLLLAGLAAAQAALASPLLFVPSGDDNAGYLQGQATLDRVGGLLLHHGSADFDGPSISISSASDPFTPAHEVLSGRVVRVELSGQGSQQSLTGLVVFLAGPLAASLDPDGAEDLVFRNEGAVSGHILKIDNGQVVLVNKNGLKEAIDLHHVLFIRSPRAFTFHMDSKAAKVNHTPGTASGDMDTSLPVVSLRSTAPASSIALSSVIPGHQVDLVSNSADEQGEPQHSLLDEANEPIFPFWSRFSNHRFGGE